MKTLLKKSALWPHCFISFVMCWIKKKATTEIVLYQILRLHFTRSNEAILCGTDVKMNLGVWLVAENMRWSFLHDDAQDVQIKTATSLAFVSLLKNCHWHTDCLIYSHALIVVCLLGAQVVLLSICNITSHLQVSFLCETTRTHTRKALRGKKCTCTENTVNQWRKS